MPSTQPSLKNTKQEILDAYEQVVDHLSQKDSHQPQSATFANQPKLTSIDPKSPEEIVTKVGELRIGINKILVSLVEDLTTQSQLLADTKKSLEVAKEELEKNYKIKQTASTLQNILDLYEQKKLELEKGFSILENEFEIKKDQKIKDQKEQEELLKVSRRREQEEFDYNLKQSRKKEADEYEVLTNTKVKELESREKQLIDSEAELNNLRILSTEFETKINEEILKTSKKSAEETQKNLEIKYNLEKKDVEMQNQLAMMTIENQKKNIEQLESEVTDLKKQLIIATQQVKDIAVKVIENKSSEKLLSSQI